MTRGPSREPNYTALDITALRFHPPSLKSVVPLEKRVCLQERPGEERQGPGQKTVLRPALFCMVAAVFFSPFFFCLFFSLVRLPLWGRDGGWGADMMDGTWGLGRDGGGCGEDGDGGAQCRAPCLRGTCEAWGGHGWWVDSRRGGGSTACVCVSVFLSKRVDEIMEEGESVAVKECAWDVWVYV